MAKLEIIEKLQKGVEEKRKEVDRLLVQLGETEFTKNAMKLEI